MERADVRLEHRLLPDLEDAVLDLGAGRVVGLLDAGRVDAAVLQELLEREARNLAPDAVEAREDHGAGRVVDDEVDAGEHLERADVAALAADDAALQVVGLERHRGDSRLDGVTAREALHDRGEDAAGAAIGLPAGRLLDLTDEAGAVRAELVLELAQEDLPRLRRAQVGDPLELAHVLALRRLQLLRLRIEVAGTVGEAALLARCVLEADLERFLL